MDSARNFLDFFWALGSSQSETRVEAAANLVEFLVERQARASGRGPSSASPVDASALGGSLDSLPADGRPDHQKGKKKKGGKGRHDHGQSIKNLISFQGTAACDDLQYAANRLLAGLTSSRACVRQGYSLALLLLLLHFKKEIPKEKVLTALEQHTSIAKAFPADVKTLLLGRLFGYAVLQKTGYFTSNACLTQCSTVFSSLWEIVDKKVYLQEAAFRLMRRIVVDLSTFNRSIALQFVHARLGALAAVRVNAAHAAAPSDGEEPPKDEADGGKQLGKTVTGRLPCSLAAFLLDLRWEACRSGWANKQENFPHLDVLFNLDLLQEKERPRLMAFLADTAAFHPRLHSLWDACLTLLLHSSIDADPQEAFLRWCRSVDKTLFPAASLWASPALKDKAAQKTENGRGQVEPQTLQKAFLGFRLAVEVLIRLKHRAMVPEAPDALTCKNTRTDGKRQLTCEEALASTSQFWASADGFLRSLVRHLEGSRGDPLRLMADRVLDILIVVFTGRSVSSLPSLLSVSLEPSASSASPRGANVVSPFPPVASVGKPQEHKPMKTVHLECGCLRDPTEEGLFESLLFKDGEGDACKGWVHQQLSAILEDPENSKEKRKRKPKQEERTCHAPSPALGAHLEVVRHPLSLSLSSRFEILRAWGEAVRFHPLKKGVMKKLGLLVFGGGLTAEELRPEILLSQIFESLESGTRGLVRDGVSKASPQTLGASWRRLLWIVDFLLLLPQQFSSSGSDLSAGLPLFVSLVLSLLLSSAFQLSSRSAPLPSVVFTSPSRLLSAAKSAASSRAGALSGLSGVSVSPFFAFLFAPSRSPWPRLLPKLMSLQSFLLARHVDTFTKFHGPTGPLATAPDADPASATSPDAASRFVTALHAAHALCFALVEATETEGPSKTVSVVATADGAAARKRHGKKAASAEAEGLTVELSRGSALSAGLAMASLLSGGLAGVEASSEDEEGGGRSKAVKRKHETKDGEGAAAAGESATLLSLCFEASTRARDLDLAVRAAHSVAREPESAEAIVLKRGLGAACRALAASVASVAFYPYFAFGSRRRDEETERKRREEGEADASPARKRPRRAEDDDPDSDEADVSAFLSGSDEELEAPSRQSPLDGPLFGSQAAEWAKAKETQDEDEREELGDFATLLGDLSSQAAELTAIFRSAEVEEKNGEDPETNGGEGGTFAQLAAALAQAAQSATRLIFLEGDSASVGFLRATGRTLWKALCPFARETELQALLDIVLEREGEAAEKSQAEGKDEENESGGEDEEEDEEEEEEGDEEEGDEEEGDEGEGEEETGDEKKGPATGGGKKAAKRGTASGKKRRESEASEDESEDEGESGADEAEEDKAGSSRDTADSDTQDDNFSIELDADATYRALLDEDGDALPGAYAPPHAALRRQAQSERKQREHARLSHLQLRLRALDLLQVFLEMHPRSSQALAVLSSLFGGFDRIALRSFLRRQKKGAGKTTPTSGLHQLIADKIQKVVLDACSASGSRHRKRPLAALAARAAGDAEKPLAAERAQRLLEGERRAISLAATLLPWQASWAARGSEGPPRAPRPLHAVPPLVLAAGWDAPGRGFEGLENSVSCRVQACGDGEDAREASADKKRTGLQSPGKATRAEKSLHTAWEAAETCLGLRALEVLQTCIACRQLPQAQAAASCQYVGMSLLVHFFKVEQQIAEFFSQLLGRTRAAGSASGVEGATWGGSVASQVLNLALTDWLTKHSSRQQQLDAAFFRFFAERRPELMRFIDFLGAAHQRAKGAFVRRECVAIGAAVARHPSFLSGRADERSCKHEGARDAADSGNTAGAEAMTETQKARSAPLDVLPHVALDWGAWTRGGRRGRDKRRRREQDEAGERGDGASLPPLPVRDEVSEGTFVELLAQLASLADEAAGEGSRGAFSSASQMKASHKEMLLALKTVLQAAVAQVKRRRPSARHAEEDDVSSPRNDTRRRERSDLEAAWTRLGDKIEAAAAKLKGQAGRHQGVHDSVVRLVRTLQGKEEALSTETEARKQLKREEKRKRREERKAKGSAKDESNEREPQAGAEAASSPAKSPKQKGKKETRVKSEASGDETNAQAHTSKKLKSV
ncbi:hypothetical protein NCLIV_013790 [Neospora caninum Liverpool]|uniref:Uncharacterized protein n=1 Tax=Neospora caninum (strain Liverpool) TaxID=572307 RepID=F0VD70_NEOCL|nr:hypothetical protein NCLIV_013790 [Neospora caninum Liverpool]CBZ51585.1 hypothetical protein NCLIV_013790 [Neospora caninum Liverpool]CEL65537.1 TPA: hypothetical protein BN1204_013790 [Neospora caninum Liverpool]|eukprot:XP_003881618.1 hypothetical protein NCLIV_013790 [Neospora caninum Liverpool]